MHAPTLEQASLPSPRKSFSFCSSAGRNRGRKVLHWEALSPSFEQNCLASSVALSLKESLEV